MVEVELCLYGNLKLNEWKYHRQSSKFFLASPQKSTYNLIPKKEVQIFFPEPTLMELLMIKVSFSFGSEPMYVSDVWSPNLDLLDTQIGSCKYKNA